MPLKNFRPITPGTRNAVRASFEELTTNKPEKSLISSKKNHAGRNNRGRITVRARGGGSRRMYREVDFKRKKDGVPARVQSIEYDPNRTTRIALIFYADGEKELHSGTARVACRRRGAIRPRRRGQLGQCPAVDQHTHRHGDPQPGADPRTRRPTGARRGNRSAGALAARASTC